MTAPRTALGKYVSSLRRWAADSTKENATLVTLAGAAHGGGLAQHKGARPGWARAARDRSHAIRGRRLSRSATGARSRCAARRPRGRESGCAMKTRLQPWGVAHEGVIVAVMWLCTWHAARIGELLQGRPIRIRNLALVRAMKKRSLKRQRVEGWAWSCSECAFQDGIAVQLTRWNLDGPVTVLDAEAAGEA